MSPREAPGRLQRALDGVGAAALFLMMAVVAVDVAGRNLFNKPLPWGTELLEVVVAVMVFALYPVLALRGNHITVDLITVQPGLQRLQRLLACGVGGALFAVIAFCTGRQAVRSAGYGDASALLQVPTAWVLWGMSAMAVLTVLCFGAAARRALRGPPPGRRGPAGGG